MATITISPEEIIWILKANDILRSSNISTTGNDYDISIKIKLGFISTSVIINLITYEKHIATFEIKANKLVEKELYKKLNEIESNEIIESKHPYILINLHKLLADKIKGVVIKDLKYEKGLFRITTSETQ